MRLDYTRGPGAERCPDEHAVRHFLIGEFGYDPVQPNAATTLTISIARVGRTLHVALQLEDSTGNSLWDDGFDEPNCETLVRHSALKAKINIGYVLRPPSAAPGPAPLAPPLPPPALAPPTVAPPPPAPAPHRALSPTPQSAPTPAPAPSERLRFQVGLDALGHIGVTPSVSAGGALSVELVGRDFGLAVQGRVAASVAPAELESFNGSVPTHSLFAAVTLAPCYRRGVFVGCAVLDVGTLRFWYSGRALTAEPRLVAFGVRPALEVPLTARFALRASVEISTIVTRTMLFYHWREIWRTPHVFGAAGAGVVAAFDVPVRRANKPAR
jgi:hypothetical protein